MNREKELLSELESLGFSPGIYARVLRAWKGPIPKAGSRQDDIIFYLRADHGYNSVIDNETYYVGKNIR